MIREFTEAGRCGAGTGGDSRGRRRVKSLIAWVRNWLGLAESRRVTLTWIAYDSNGRRRFVEPELSKSDVAPPPQRPHVEPTGATWLPWVYSSGGEPIYPLNVLLSVDGGTHHPDGIEITLHGEPHRVYIVEGRVVGFGLATDTVQPVTAPTQRLQRACTACGDALPPDAVFCVACGHEVAHMVFD